PEDRPHRLHPDEAATRILPRKALLSIAGHHRISYSGFVVRSVGSCLVDSGDKKLPGAIFNVALRRPEGWPPWTAAIKNQL
ncbi:hypothetical protein, partial [Alloalcanivorax dieselolei]|uniref:hypothetical protein n=1 Tax=Alloalcanivorax dieselolei TaxID=285091 RepID=UPI001E2A54F8